MGIKVSNSKRTISQKVASGVLVAFGVPLLGIDTLQTAFLVEIRALLASFPELLDSLATYVSGVVH